MMQWETRHYALDGDIGISFAVYPEDDGQWTWAAYDPDGEPFDQFENFIDPPCEATKHDTPEEAMAEAETWYARWLAADDGEEGEG